MARGGLGKWFGQRWVNIGAPKKGGKYQPCGRRKAKKNRRGYPKCVPAAKAAAMTKAQIKSAVRRKRANEEEVGNETLGLKELECLVTTNLNVRLNIELNHTLLLQKLERE